MARGDQLARQWKIIQTLIASKMGKSAKDLADDLDYNKRTIYRDLDALEKAGFPIYKEQVDGKKHWLLLEIVKQNIPIPFTLPELMALYFSRDVLNVLKDTAFYESLETLFQKVKTTLPAESKEYLGQIEDSLKVGPKPYKQYGKFKEIINQVNEAVVYRKYIDITYYTMSRKKWTVRKVAPYKIWYFDGTFYLIGHCDYRDDIRIFALDRIKMLHLKEEAFKIPDEFDIDEFMRSSFGVFVGKPTYVKIWFSADIAGYIKEKIWHESQQIRRQSDGSIIFEAEVAVTEEIKYWIKGWGSQALVFEPESLREEIRSESVKMLERYSSDMGKEESLTA
jgi:predicted DNA-binding transcriptional regulator YafY